MAYKFNPFTGTFDEKLDVGSDINEDLDLKGYKIVNNKIDTNVGEITIEPGIQVNILSATKVADWPQFTVNNLDGFANGDKVYIYDVSPSEAATAYEGLKTIGTVNTSTKTFYFSGVISNGYTGGSDVTGKLVKVVKNSGYSIDYPTVIIPSLLLGSVTSAGAYDTDQGNAHGQIILKAPNNKGIMRYHPSGWIEMGNNVADSNDSTKVFNQI